MESLRCWPSQVDYLVLAAVPVTASASNRSVLNKLKSGSRTTAGIDGLLPGTLCCLAVQLTIRGVLGVTASMLAVRGPASFAGANFGFAAG